MLPIKIDDNKKGPGYIYFIRFKYFPTCYKVGSTGNPFSRFKAHSGLYGPLNILIYAYVSDRLRYERFIQNMIRGYSNNHLTKKAKSDHISYEEFSKMDLIGSIISSEYFIMDQNSAEALSKVIIGFGGCCLNPLFS